MESTQNRALSPRPTPLFDGARMRIRPANPSELPWQVVRVGDPGRTSGFSWRAPENCRLLRVGQFFSVPAVPKAVAVGARSAPQSAVEALGAWGPRSSDARGTKGPQVLKAKAKLLRRPSGVTVAGMERVRKDTRSAGQREPSRMQEGRR